MKHILLAAAGFLAVFFIPGCGADDGDGSGIPGPGESETSLSAPATIANGELAEITFTVANNGEEAVLFDATLDWDPQPAFRLESQGDKTAELELDAGESATVTWLAEARKTGDASLLVQLATDEDVVDYTHAIVIQD